MTFNGGNSYLHGVCACCLRQPYPLDAQRVTAVSYYTLAGGVMTFTHTEVPPQARGGGIASRLIAGALEAARARGLKIVARCPFVGAYLGKHPEFNDLLA